MPPRPRVLLPLLRRADRNLLTSLRGRRCNLRRPSFRAEMSQTCPLPCPRCRTAMDEMVSIAASGLGPTQYMPFALTQHSIFSRPILIRIREYEWPASSSLGTRSGEERRTLRSRSRKRTEKIDLGMRRRGGGRTEQHDQRGTPSSVLDIVKLNKLRP